jgi:hypothetical protein
MPEIPAPITAIRRGAAAEVSNGTSMSLKSLYPVFHQHTWGTPVQIKQKLLIQSYERRV